MDILPYKVEAGEDDKPLIRIDNYCNQTKRFTPEEISAVLLEKMKTYADSFLGAPCTKAVVTVPAYFNNA